MNHVSVVLVTFNTRHEIGGCLDALANVADIEIIVIDNASEDSTEAEVSRRGVPIIVNPNNTGFSAAVNQGVRLTTAPLVLLLNPDAHLVQGLDALIRR